jgi:tagatose-1,6-bisphosphate aldolase
MSTMTQEKLQQIHINIATLISHHASGIMTDLEFINAISDQAPRYDYELSGLVDVNTGLRYK